MILAISDETVRRLIDVPTAVEVLADTCRAAARGGVSFAERSNLMLPKGWMRMSPAALADDGVMGYKEFHLTAATGIRFSIWLFDLNDGRPLALVDGKHITAIRTGACGGLAVRHLAPPDARRVGVIGSSDFGYRQLEATAAVRALDRVRVFSPTPANRERFARRAAEQLGIDAEAVGDPDAATGDADIVLIATDTRGRGPAVDDAVLSPGLHVNSIGSTLPNQRELHHDIWGRVDRLVTDTPGALRDSGDLIAAANEGTLEGVECVGLDDVVAGRHPGRLHTDEITVFKSVGTSAQDVAAALHVYRAARDRGLGRELPDIIEVKDD